MYLYNGLFRFFFAIIRFENGYERQGGISSSLARVRRLSWQCLRVVVVVVVSIVSRKKGKRFLAGVPLLAS